jgi:integrase
MLWSRVLCLLMQRKHISESESDLPDFNRDAGQLRLVQKEMNTAIFIRTLWDAETSRHADPELLTLVVRCSWNNKRKAGKNPQPTNRWRNQYLAGYFGISPSPQNAFPEHLARACPTLAKGDIAEHIVRDYLIRRWGNEIADEIKSLDIQRWLQSLSPKLAWPTIAKMRGVMSRTYKVGIRHALVSTNPLLHVETRCTSSYRAIVLSPEQTLAILKSLAALLHRILVLTCAATALRASELLALLWSDIRWDEGRIRVSKRWANGKHGQTKTEASDGYVPLHPILAQHLRELHTQTPYGKETDFVFPSLQADGRVPLSPSAFVADHLRPAAKAAGVKIKGGQRFGLHNLRHSLSNWLVNKAKVEPKTVQSILRHSRIQTTLDLYTQEDSDETRAAQGEFLQALGMQSELVQ